MTSTNCDLKRHVDGDHIDKEENVKKRKIESPKHENREEKPTEINDQQQQNCSEKNSMEQDVEVLPNENQENTEQEVVGLQNENQESTNQDGLRLQNKEQESTNQENTKQDAVVEQQNGNQDSMEQETVVEPQKDDEMNTENEKNVEPAASISSFGGFASMAGKSQTVSFASFAANSNTNGFQSFATTNSNATGFQQNADPAFGFEKETSSTSTFNSLPTASLDAIRADISISNGEEDEDVVFQTRAKLFKYRDQAWVECGVGPFRILVAKESEDGLKKCRLVMRRESVPNGHGTKLILNVAVSSHMTVKLQGERALAIACMEKSEEDNFVPVSYCLRVENADKANLLLNHISSRIE